MWEAEIFILKLHFQPLDTLCISNSTRFHHARRPFSILSFAVVLDDSGSFTLNFCPVSNNEVTVTVAELVSEGLTSSSTTRN